MGMFIAVLIRFVTLPGVMTQLLALRLMCDLTGVRVYAVDYAGGTLEHGPTGGPGRALVLTVGPLIINTLFCSILTFPTALSIMVNSQTGFSGLGMLSAWLGISCGVHAFPSSDVTRSLLDAAGPGARRSLLGYVQRACSGLFAVIIALRVVWIDVVYAVAIAGVGPWLLLVRLNLPIVS